MTTEAAVGATFYLRVLDTATGFYSRYQGKVMDSEPFNSHEEAEEIRNAMANGAEFEIVAAGEIVPATTP